MAAGDAKHRFLDAAARLYVTTAPATSAHLMLQAHTVACDGKVVGRDESTCKACGTILITGWTSLTRVIDLDAEARLSAKSKMTMKKKALVIECLGCHRYIKRPLEPVTRAPTKRIARQASISAGISAKSLKPGSENAARPATTNSSSKQRAKTRKQGGLQAMLERSKKQPNSPPGSGLDLMDFMKQG